MEDGNKKVEGTEEEKPKGLIDRFWWVIPPVFFVVVYLPLAIQSLAYLSPGDHQMTISFERYIATLKKLYIYSGPYEFSEFWAFFQERLLFLGFCFGFMAVGMLFTRKRSLIIRITVPIIFAILGSIIALVGFIILLKWNYYAYGLG